MTLAMRRGVAQTLTLDVDAVELLPQLAPSTKCYGRFMRELIRQEWVRRETRHEERIRIAVEQEQTRAQTSRMGEKCGAFLEMAGAEMGTAG
jgi:hypothetical protein